MREPFHVLVLLGLLIEILGAFVLAIDAIGLDRFDRWITNLHGLGNEIAGEKERTGSTFTDPRRFIAGTASALGVAAGYWLLQPPPAWAADIPRVWLKIGGAISASLIGALLGLVLFKVIVVLLHRGAHLLQNLRDRARVHAVGVLGFGLLLVGFLLQFLGTLGDMLRVSR